MLLLAACGQPRPDALKGEVCRSILADGYAPYSSTDIKPDVLVRNAVSPAAEVTVPTANRAFRDHLTSRYAGRAATGPRVKILAVSAGGAWGAFSAGFLDGWGRNPGADKRPQFDVVTGVSTGSMLAPIMFLGREPDIERLRAEYRELTNDKVFTRRSLFGLLSAPSIYDTTPLRRRVESIVDDAMVEDIAREHGKRTLAVMAVNLDSGQPKIFDLTEIAARATPVADRRGRIINAIMASAAIPIGFPPVFIDGDMYVDGGVRSHAFIVQEVVAALSGNRPVATSGGLDVYRLSERGPALDLTIVVSGDMKVMRDCVGSGHLDLLSIAGRTATVMTDQLLRNSIELLLAQVGRRVQNHARYIDAADLVAYPRPGSNPSETPDGRCIVPVDGEDQFVPAFQTCLDTKAFALGQRPQIPWRITVRASAVQRAPQTPAVTGQR
jgi:predicted patatin/cPLA2 family phospholipase